jgi:hypothetical protein
MSKIEGYIIALKATRRMAVNLSTETIQTTISQLNRDFAGRSGSNGYDETKLLHIHRRNRAFVWDKDMQANFLDSILKGYYIPPIICCSRIVNGVERREIMEGGNRITTIRRILNNEVRPLTIQEKQQVEAFGVALVVMRNLTAYHQRKMFRRLNKNVKVSDGQLYAMSIDDSSLVKEADELLNSDSYPLRALITEHCFDTRGKDNDGKANLSNAVALVSGAIHGVHYITKSYNVQDPMVDSQDPIDRAKVVQVLGPVLEIFSLADQTEPQPDGRKRRAQWSVGNWMGAMLYDILMNPGQTRRIQEKWARYIVKVRRNDVGAEDATKISGAQNLTATRYLKISTKVDIYLRDNRLATDQELHQLAHPDDDPEESDDDESVE